MVNLKICIFLCYLFIVSLSFSVIKYAPLISDLATQYFGARSVIVIVDHYTSESQKVVQVTSQVGLLATVLDYKDFCKVSDHYWYPKTIVVAMAVASSSVRLSKLSHNIPMSNYHWIVFSDLEDKYFESFNLPYDCKFVLVSTKKDMKLKELYKIDPSSSLSVNILGLWDFEKGITLVTSGFYSRRLNFKGSTLNYLTPRLGPCIDQSFAAGNVVLCINEMVWNITVEALNATTKAVVLKNGRVPLSVANKFAEGKEQASLPGFFLNSYEKNILSFFWPIFKTELEVFTQYAGMEISWNRYLKPFSSNIWIAVLCWILGCCLLLCIARRLLLTFAEINCNCGGCRLEQFWTPLFAFLNQGATEPADKLWERLLLLSAFLAPAVLIPAYGASLTSFLAVQIPDMPFTDLSEMKDHSNYRLTGTKDYNLSEIFKNKEDETSKYFMAHGILEEGKRPLNDSEGVMRMCREPLSFIASRFAITALKPTCKYYSLPKKFLTIHQSMTMPKNSPYANAFNIIMRNIRFSGVLQTLKYSVTKEQIYTIFMDEEKTILPPVNFSDICLLLFWILGMIIVSIVILLAERYVFQMPKNHVYPMYPYLK